MINIQNKENEECKVWVIDYRGHIYYEGELLPEENVQIDLKELAFGIYKMIFKTEHTSYIQEFVKY